MCRLTRCFSWAFIGKGGPHCFSFCPPLRCLPSSLPTIFCCLSVLCCLPFVSCLPLLLRSSSFRGNPSFLLICLWPLVLYGWCKPGPRVGPWNRQGPLPSPQSAGDCWDSGPTPGLAGVPQGCPAEGDISDGIQSTKDLLVGGLGLHVQNLYVPKHIFTQKRSSLRFCNWFYPCRSKKWNHRQG